MGCGNSTGGDQQQQNNSQNKNRRGSAGDGTQAPSKANMHGGGDSHSGAGRAYFTPTGDECEKENPSNNTNQHHQQQNGTGGNGVPPNGDEDDGLGDEINTVDGESDAETSQQGESPGQPHLLGADPGSHHRPLDSGQHPPPGGYHNSSSSTLGLGARRFSKSFSHQSFSQVRNSTVRLRNAKWHVEDMEPLSTGYFGVTHVATIKEDHTQQQQQHQPLISALPRSESGAFGQPAVTLHNNNNTRDSARGGGSAGMTPTATGMNGACPGAMASVSSSAGCLTPREASYLPGTVPGHGATLPSPLASTGGGGMNVPPPSISRKEVVAVKTVSFADGSVGLLAEALALLEARASEDAQCIPYEPTPPTLASTLSGRKMQSVLLLETPEGGGGAPSLAVGVASPPQATASLTPAAQQQLRQDNKRSSAASLKEKNYNQRSSVASSSALVGGAGGTSPQQQLPPLLISKIYHQLEKLANITHTHLVHVIEAKLYIPSRVVLGSGSNLKSNPDLRSVTSSTEPENFLCTQEPRHSTGASPPRATIFEGGSSTGKKRGSRASGFAFRDDGSNKRGSRATAASEGGGGSPAMFNLPPGGGEQGDQQQQQLKHRVSHTSPLPPTVDLSKPCLQITSEYVDGGNLLGAKGHMTIDNLLQLIHNLAKVLKFLHVQGLSHLNLRSRNVLQADGDHYCLSDCGFAPFFMALTPEELYNISKSFRHSGYYPPEYLAAKKITSEMSEKVEVWQLGVLGYRLLYGEDPFIKKEDSPGHQLEVHSFQHKKASTVFSTILQGQVEFPIVAGHGWDVPSNVIELIQSMLDKDPTSRFNFSQILKSDVIHVRVKESATRGGVFGTPSTQHLNILEGSDSESPGRNTARSQYTNSATTPSSDYVHSIKELAANANFTKDFVLTLETVRSSGDMSRGSGEPTSPTTTGSGGPSRNPSRTSSNRDMRSFETGISPVAAAAAERRRQQRQSLSVPGATTPGGAGGPRGRKRSVVSIASVPSSVPERVVDLAVMPESDISCSQCTRSTKPVCYRCMSCEAPAPVYMLCAPCYREKDSSATVHDVSHVFQSYVVEDMSEAKVIDSFGFGLPQDRPSTTSPPNAVTGGGYDGEVDAPKNMVEFDASVSSATLTRCRSSGLHLLASTARPGSLPNSRKASSATVMLSTAAMTDTEKRHFSMSGALPSRLEVTASVSFASINEVESQGAANSVVISTPGQSTTINVAPGPISAEPGGKTPTLKPPAPLGGLGNIPYLQGSSESDATSTQGSTDGSVTPLRLHATLAPTPSAGRLASTPLNREQSPLTSAQLDLPAPPHMHGSSGPPIQNPTGPPGDLNPYAAPHIVDLGASATGFNQSGSSMNLSTSGAGTSRTLGGGGGGDTGGTGGLAGMNKTKIRLFVAEADFDAELTIDESIEECAMKGYTDLVLTNRELTEFPPLMFTPKPLSMITILDLAKNALTEIPDSITVLSSIQKLYLMDNQLTELPSALGDLQNLVYLDVTKNKLSDLPTELLYCDNLSSITIDSNEFSEFPGVLSDIPCLTTFYAADNYRICRWPDAACLSQMSKVTIGVDNEPRLFREWNDTLAAKLGSITVQWNKVFPDEITDNLFCGSLRSAQTPYVYATLKINSVLTVGRGLEPIIGEGMQQKSIIVDDIDGATIDDSFGDAVDFIDDNLKSGLGCLVHCFAGMSRSATTIIAFLMCKRGMRLDEAYLMTKKGRPAIYPNHGFFKQLVKLDAELFPDGRPLDIDSLHREIVP